ncbi:MAG TPA: DUF423 domain-containing protein [Steroidobacteraceae bacterium]|nr:DUF423 domain-containing protein [Steroidobacteraceae bacterium]
MKGERAIGLGALLLAIGIGIGALGAHALRDVLDAPQLEALHTAVYYQVFNSLGLMMAGGWVRMGRTDLAWPLRLLAGGVVLFSGSIYLMLAGAPRPFGILTPVGGAMLICAWLALAWRYFRKP